MSSTTPMRKSRRINTQPSSETHRNTATQPATPIADPQKAPSSARPASAQILEPIRRQDRSSSGGRAFREAAAMAFGNCRQLQTIVTWDRYDSVAQAYLRPTTPFPDGLVVIIGADIRWRLVASNDS